MAFLIQTELPERSTAALRYEPCTQFINVSQRALHIYWQFSAMSHAIHKIVSKRRCQSYFISRRSPHHGISKNSDLCASAHRSLHYAYARLIARVNSQFTSLMEREGISVLHDTDHGLAGIEYNLIAVVIIILRRTVIGSLLPVDMNTTSVCEEPSIACGVVTLER